MVLFERHSAMQKIIMFGRWTPPEPAVGGWSLGKLVARINYFQTELAYEVSHSPKWAYKLIMFWGRKVLLPRWP